jgi:lipoprotein-anchoring transpeptidase ErfK/SrfK
MQKLSKFALLVFLLAFSAPCLAQGWSPWDELFGGRRSYDDRRWQESDRPSRFEDRTRRHESRKPPPAGGDIRSGGARPEITAETPPTVDFAYDFPAHSIVIVTGSRKLYYVLPDQKAYEYRVSVGREGFNWNGTEKVSRKQAWPDWHPPAEMRERDPSLPEKMTGGLKNPLGAIALYLGDTLYRIHGTNDVKSIGQAQSSGCFRMLNTAVLHLAAVTEIGTSVSVVPALSDRARISRAPEASPAPAFKPAPPANQQLPPDRPAAPANLPPPAADPPARSANQQPLPDRPAAPASQPPAAANQAARPANQEPPADRPAPPAAHQAARPANQQPPPDRPAAPANQRPSAADLPARSANQQPLPDRSATPTSRPPPAADKPARSANQLPPASPRVAQPSQPIAANSERDSLPDYGALRNYTLGKK